MQLAHIDHPARTDAGYPLCPIRRLRQAIVAGDRKTARDTADMLAEAFAEDAADIPSAHVIDATRGEA